MMLDDSAEWGDIMYDEDERAGVHLRSTPSPVVVLPVPLPAIQETRAWLAEEAGEDADDEPEWIRGAKGMLERTIHLDASGEPEECKFFNLASGCRLGDKCSYKHIKREQQQPECRFFRSARGCRAGA